jgi:ribosomal protein L14
MYLTLDTMVFLPDNAGVIVNPKGEMKGKNPPLFAAIVYLQRSEYFPI